MKKFTVAMLMVPLSEYATVFEDATLYDAVMALEKVQEKFTYKHSEYRHRAILVLNPKGRVVGKISQIDVLRALEPKYKEILEGKGFRGVGFSKKLLKSMSGRDCPDRAPRACTQWTYLAQNLGLSAQQVGEVQWLVERHADEIRSAWWNHFGR